MSPTYATASRIIAAAHEHGWEIIKANANGVWGAYDRNRNKVELKEDRNGGLRWVRLRYMVPGGVTVDYFGQDYRGKLDEVLDFLADPTIRSRLSHTGGGGN